jgi:hypothetical protein
MNSHSTQPAVYQIQFGFEDEVSFIFTGTMVVPSAASCSFNFRFSKWKMPDKNQIPNLCVVTSKTLFIHAQALKVTPS